MTHDSLIGSTVCTISEEDVSCVSKMSSPSISTVYTEMSKRSPKSNVHDFYPKNQSYIFAKKRET
jgi:hypothetical protein